MNATNDARTGAIERIKAKQEFQSHAVSYVVINALLIVVWALAGGGYFWPIWVLLGWGAGLILHGYVVYLRKPITEAEIQTEMTRGADDNPTPGL